MTIAIYGRRLDKNYFVFANDLIEVLLQKNIEVVIYHSFYKFLKNSVQLDDRVGVFSSDQEIATVDFLLSIGGDGTLLDTVTLVRDKEIPVLGINTGRLGFLTTVTTENIQHTVQEIIDGKFQIDKRTLLSLYTDQGLFGDVNYALNEITLQKKDTSSMITINAYIDGEYLNSYWADGLIVSTPTGSTAYSLSCNGPIILPRSGNIILNPIAPHNLNVRPIVVPDDIELTLRIEGRTGNFLVALDSRSETVAMSKELKIKKSDHHINLVRLNNYTFLDTLRNKLMWGMDKRN